MDNGDLTPLFVYTLKSKVKNYWPAIEDAIGKTLQ